MAETSVEPRNTGTHHWIGVIGLFIAPTTVITSLCYYFGFVYTRRNLGYFGVDSSALGYSTADYVLGSVSVLYAPIIGGILAWVGMWCAGHYLRRLASEDRWTRHLSTAGWVAVAAGCVGVVRGLVGMTLPQFAVPAGAAWTAAGTGVGGAILLLGTWLLATLSTARSNTPLSPVWRAALAVSAGLTVLGMFWVTGNLAAHYGDEQAAATQSRLWANENSLMVDTSERLNAPEQLIKETRINSAKPKSGIQFRYLCFRALAVEGNRWVLVPAAWEPQHGYALMLDADDSNRISFTRRAGIADTTAADWAGNWPCPEVAPGQ